MSIPGGDGLISGKGADGGGHVCWSRSMALRPDIQFRGMKAKRLVGLVRKYLLMKVAISHVFIEGRFPGVFPGQPER